jgi:RNA polymerase sigma factor (sigma-70 family)
MAAIAAGFVMQGLRRAVLQHEAAALTDAQLLARFVEHHDEIAFAALMERHARMVYGVCRRVLHNFHDAEDAFQAAFLILARKASTVQPRERVGNWLYGVAWQTSRKARAIMARRTGRERQMDQMPEPAQANRNEANDWQPLLDRELSRLPDKYRVPIVLCDLEGKGHKEAADQLGWPQGTLSGRLSRARDLLARRLRKHGFALPAGSLTALLANDGTSAPAHLMESTARTASLAAAGQTAVGLVSARVAVLMEGVMKSMLLTKVSIASAIVCSALLGIAGTSVFTQHALAQREKAEAVAQREQRPGPDGRVFRAEVRGMLRSVDASKNTITVMVFEGRPNEGRRESEEKTFTVAKDVEVGVNVGDGRGRGFQREVKLADLTPGVNVSLTLSMDQKLVEAITADGPSVRGTVKSIDAANNTLTIVLNRSGRDEEPMEKTLTVSTSAEIGIDDGRGKRFSIKEGKLADVTPGCVAMLWLTVDQKFVAAAQFEGPNVTGNLRSVDINKNTVTIAQFQRGAEAEEKTYELAKDTLKLIDDGKGRRFSLKEGKLADMPAGSLVFMKLSPDQKHVGMIRAEGPYLSAMLKSIDAAKGTITFITPVRGENPEEKTLPIAKDVRIMSEGAVVKLADVKIEDNTFAQLRLSLDQKTVQLIVIGRGR